MNLIETVISRFEKVDKRTFSMFLMVGALTAAAYFAIFTLLWKILHIDYRVSVTLAYVSSVTFQFFSNRNLTFKKKSDSLFFQGVRYMGLLIINYLITISIVEYTVKFLLLSPYLGIVFSVGVTVFTGYFLSKRWVYKTV